MLRLVSCGLIFSALITAPAQTRSSSALIGIVVSARGNWCDQSHQPCTPLWKMYPVREDSKLIRMQPVTGDESVTIRSRWGARETFDCAKPRELGCKDTLDISRLIVEQRPRNVVTSFLDAVSELAADQPNVYASFREAILQVRGTEEQELSDGVARLEEQGLNLENIFKNAKGGVYLLELCPLGDQDEPKCADPPSPLNYSWNPPKAALYPVAKVHPGIYRLYKCEETAATVRRRREYADVLVAAGTSYERILRNFQQVVDATKGWDATDDTAPALRRAFLFTLSRK